jgi:hypothetical protein
MAEPVVRVELGLELLSDPNAAILDDPVKGILDSPTYTLGGVNFYDISDRIRSVSTRRGKSQALDKIDSGTVSILADNNDRLFDPLYQASPFYGALVPRRKIRIYANDKFVFDGYIDDFNLTYEPNGNSTVQMECSDAFSVLTKAKLDEQTPTSQLSGARIQAILNRPEVNWAASERDIDSGVFTMLDTTIPQDTSAIEYLQTVANSEFGDLFIGKDGKIVFRDRDYAPAGLSVIISDGLADENPDAIPFVDVNIVYGSEYLYNRIVISNSDVIPEESIAEDANSQLFYGVLTYSATDLLTENAADLDSLAQSLLEKYKEPVYRFESVTHILNVLDDTKQNEILDIEIGDYVLVEFQPNNIPPSIVQPCKVIGISHSWDITNKSVTLSLERIQPGIWTLSDPILGRLSVGNFLG